MRASRVASSKLGAPGADAYRYEVLCNAAKFGSEVSSYGLMTSPTHYDDIARSLVDEVGGIS